MCKNIKFNLIIRELFEFLTYCQLNGQNLGISEELDEMKKSIRSMRSSIISEGCLLYTSPSPRDGLLSRMPSSA